MFVKISLGEKRTKFCSHFLVHEFLSRLFIYDDDDDDDDDDDGDDSYCACSTPCSYRQPGGRGQLLPRRYCTQSGCLFSCANRTARESQGALAVSCKYFKQSKWPFMATSIHVNSPN